MSLDELRQETGKLEKKVKRYEQQGVAMTCRSFAEYEKMFDLTDIMVQNGPVLDVSAGASSFSADLKRKGLSSIAVDPQYIKSPETLFAEGQKELRESAIKLKKVEDMYDWGLYGTFDEFVVQREKSLQRFIDDYRLDRSQYVPASLPLLPFKDHSFSLVLCSHFLFLYEDQFNLDFHLASLRELSRVCHPAGEVRVYPLVGLDATLYKEMPLITKKLDEQGLTVTFEETNFHFFKGATHYLRIKKGFQK